MQHMGMGIGLYTATSALLCALIIVDPLKGGTRGIRPDVVMTRFFLGWELCETCRPEEKGGQKRLTRWFHCFFHFTSIWGRFPI